MSRRIPDRPAARARARGGLRDREAAPVFAALGHESRLRLVALLCAGGALSITQLTAGGELTRQAVTKHLQVLADAGLVRDARVGRERLWSFQPARLDEARLALEAIGRQWDEALGRLARHLGE
jgi:DNA-binding transcriptional ArsR family regulator